MKTPISYPTHIDVGQEPPGFTLINTSGGYTYYKYFDAEYYTYNTCKYYYLQKLNKTEDCIKNILIQPQTQKKNGTLYKVHNLLTGQDMMLYKRKASFRNKGGATTSFINYMKWEHRMKDFDLTDFRKLVEGGVIEIRELN